MPPREPDFIEPPLPPLAWDALPGLFPRFADPGRWLPLLRRHLELVEAAAGRVRVTAVARPDAIRRQYAESLELLRMAGPFEGSICDVGSGGGYPGIIVAAVLPEVPVHLVEPLRKRAGLLEEMATALGLANVTVHALRAEEAGRGPLREQHGLVLARAVAEVRELLEYTAPLACPGGVIALPKGSRVHDELASAATAMRELGCVLTGCELMRAEVNAAVTVVRFTRDGAMPAKYPRRPGIPGKRPL